MPGGKKKSRRKNYRAWLPKATGQERAKDGGRQMRDGEPSFMPMRRWENDRTLSTQAENVCCDCGLTHLWTFNVFKGMDGQFWLVRRPYRIDGPAAGKKKRKVRSRL